ncbi:PAS domain-containing protein [Spirosoma taeanense]|uniref:histidine kinase n=1 Tax=Spirosoma taeanense TaxID=2735870 RepID=A0A6M5YAA3_9BACT|nr:ATP-binding protein [Spirosoma taeanense]QJW91127.1 PAS domain-containing protein [Spirosoma taeanense]
MKSPSMTPSASPALLRAALNLSGNGIMLFDCLRTATDNIQDFRLILANRRAEEIVGMSEQEMLNRTGTELFPHYIATELWQQARHVVETGEVYQADIQSPLASHSDEGWFRLTLQKHGDGIAVAFTDISATKQYELELRKLIDNLQRSNQSLERFAYVVSHDLQEPLRKIQSFGDILRGQATDVSSEENIDLIRRMQLAAGRMNALIRDLLAFSRLSSQQEPFQSVNLQKIVNDVLGDLETAIRDRQAVVEIPELPAVMGDAVQLRQLFQNLLSNALKFIKPGDTPHVRITCEQLSGRAIQTMPGQTVATADLDRMFYAIHIADNGIGFDEKYLDRIFTAFQRLHTRTEYQGTGIGLAIVQKVIENHDGYINAHSQPGEGATFTIYLPESAAPAMISGLSA